MKNKLQAILPLILIALCVVWMGVGIFFTISDHQDYSASVEFRGHKYVLFHADGTNATIHDPDCPCHKNGDEL